MGARGRKPIQVNLSDLQTQIIELEKAQPDGKFPNRSALWSGLEATEWAKTREPRPLSAQVAMILAKNANLDIQTPVGQKGRVKGQGPVNVGPRKKRTAEPVVLDALTNGMPKDAREKYSSVIKKACGGSLKSVIKLKCLDCCNWEKKEVSFCTVLSCPNWMFRPYKAKESLTDEGRNRISLGLVQEKSDDSEQADNS